MNKCFVVDAPLGAAYTIIFCNRLWNLLESIQPRSYVFSSSATSLRFGCDESRAMASAVFIDRMGVEVVCGVGLLTAAFLLVATGACWAGCCFPPERFTFGLATPGLTTAAPPLGFTITTGRLAPSFGLGAFLFLLPLLPEGFAPFLPAALAWTLGAAFFALARAACFWASGGTKQRIYNSH